MTNISKERSINIYLCANEQEGVFLSNKHFFVEVAGLIVDVALLILTVVQVM